MLTLWGILFTAWPGLTVDPLCLDLALHACVTPTQSLCLCPFLPPSLSLCPPSLLFSPSLSPPIPPSLPLLRVCLSPVLRASCVVEEPRPISDRDAPLAAPSNGQQGPVPVSLICWYRAQSSSFSDSCRSLEVMEPGGGTGEDCPFTPPLAELRIVTLISPLLKKREV